MKVTIGKTDIPFPLIRNTILSYYVQSMFFFIHRAYLMKARGGTDDLGNSWKPLKEVTIKRKLGRFRIRQELPRSGPVFQGRQRALFVKLRSVLLSRYRAMMPASQAEALATSRAGELLAKRQLAGTNVGLLDPGFVPVMVDRGRLLASFVPGTVDRSGAYIESNSDQRAEISPAAIRIGTKVPYAASADRERPIIPANAAAWFPKAVERAARLAFMKLGIPFRFG